MPRLNSFRHQLTARCCIASVVTEGFKMTFNCSSSVLFCVRVNDAAHVCNYEVFGRITSFHFVCSHLTQSSLVTLGFKTTLSYLAGVSFRVRVNTTFHVHSHEVFGHLQSSFITESLILLIPCTFHEISFSSDSQASLAVSVIPPAISFRSRGSRPSPYASAHRSSHPVGNICRSHMLPTITIEELNRRGTIRVQRCKFGRINLLGVGNKVTILNSPSAGRIDYP